MKVWVFAEAVDDKVTTATLELLTKAREIGCGYLVDRLVLGRHDPLERRVARLDDTGGDTHDRGQRSLDLVVAGFGLALHLHLAVGRLGEDPHLVHCHLQILLSRRECIVGLGAIKRS